MRYAELQLSILYLHGFASSPAGAKAGELRTRFARRGVSVLTPDLNRPSFEALSFGAMSAAAAATAVSSGARVLVGSSLGALVALEVVRVTPVPLVLIAPALGFGSRWTLRLPEGAAALEVTHHADGRLRLVHRSFFEEMRHVEVDRQPPPVPVTIVMGSADESVPYQTVRSIWERWEPGLAPGSEFITVEGGDHGLVSHLDVIETAIKRALELSRN